MCEDQKCCSVRQRETLWRLWPLRWEPQKAIGFRRILAILAILIWRLILKDGYWYVSIGSLAFQLVTFNGAGCVLSIFLSEWKVDLSVFVWNRMERESRKRIERFFRLFDEQFGSVATVTQNGGMQRHQLIGRDTLITLFTCVKGCEVPIETLFQKLDPARHICLVRTPLRSQLSRPTDFDATENWEKPFGWAHCFQ